jgi:HEAT repeat protein
MVKATNLSLVICLTTVCLCLLLFSPLIKNAFPQDKKEIQTLINQLKDPEVNVRRDAALALGKIGSDAKAAVPALIEVLNDKNKDVLWHAVLALGNIGPKSKAAAFGLEGFVLVDNAPVPALIEALKEGNADVRGSAAQALKNINTPEAKKALEDYERKSK